MAGQDPSQPPTFFASAEKFRAWLEANSGTTAELLVGFYKVDSGKPSMTWPESVDEALCAGWIDGVRRRIDDVSYSIRFTPRRARSIWSAVNIARVGELTRQGRMRPPGLAAFERREEGRSSIYAYEQREPAVLDAAALEQFAKTAGARENFQSLPASYRRTAIHWVTSAKRPETRQKRLATLIADSAAGRRIKQLTPSPR